MKASLKPRARPSPTDAVRIATQAAPNLPPARLSAEDRSQAFNMRLKASTLAALEDRARADGATLKQVICRALADAGVNVAPADLEDGTPRRRRIAA
jgi:hypothetical protein